MISSVCDFIYQSRYVVAMVVGLGLSVAVGQAVVGIVKRIFSDNSDDKSSSSPVASVQPNNLSQIFRRIRDHRDPYNTLAARK